MVTCVVVADSEHAAPVLATAVVGDGLPLVELTEEPADLETVFLGLTSGAR